MPGPRVLPLSPGLRDRAPPDADALSTHDEIPRPFVIAAPAAGAAEHPPGSEVAFDLTLVGRARQYLAHFVVTLREVDRMGRGRRRVALRRLDAVHPLTGAGEVVYAGGDNLVRPREASITLADCAAVPCPAGRVRVTFVTQTRLKEGTETIHLWTPAVTTAGCRTMFPDEEGTETHLADGRHGGRNVRGRTMFPDEEGTETDRTAPRGRHRHSVARCSPMRRGLKRRRPRRLRPGLASHDVPR